MHQQLPVDQSFFWAMLFVILRRERMPPGNLVTTGGASIDTRMWSCGPRGVLRVKHLVIGLCQLLRIFVERHIRPLSGK
ncbi:hypothetical protein [Ralstonia solanacearum]|uniref:hypothetical protein n=1 Tax=Ralstonia solanacearum TaxID=305 RepID=UPI0013DE5D0C|nr:hypothetical protein [Ralstonia solanacearum]